MLPVKINQSPHRQPLTRYRPTELQWALHDYFCGAEESLWIGFWSCLILKKICDEFHIFCFHNFSYGGHRVLNSNLHQELSNHHYIYSTDTMSRCLLFHVSIEETRLCMSLNLWLIYKANCSCISLPQKTLWCITPFNYWGRYGLHY